MIRGKEEDEEKGQETNQLGNTLNYIHANDYYTSLSWSWQGFE